MKYRDIYRQIISPYTPNIHIEVLLCLSSLSGPKQARWLLLRREAHPGQSSQ